MSRFYGFLYRLFAALFRKIYRLEIRGAENEPTEGPLLVCGNHTAFSDVIVIAIALHRQVHFFAKAELFKIPIFRHFIRAMGAYPVKRGQADVQSIKHTLSLLQEGKVVGLFPQGHRYPGVHPSETPVRQGIAMIAARSQANILPIAISTKGYRLRAFRRTVVTIGKPLTCEELGLTGNDHTIYQKAAEDIFRHVTDLVEKQG